MRKKFLTGLAILLPFVLTLMILSFFVRLITYPFVGLATIILSHFIPPHHEQVVHLVAQLLILFSIVALLFVVGFFGRVVLVDYVLRYGERFMQRVPIVRQIYKTVKEVVHIFFAKDKQKFSQVVLVPFPHKKVYCIGMVTAESADSKVSVFVPSTPNPTVGFMVIYEKKDLVLVNMKVEEAFKYIVSCGVTTAKDNQQ